MYPSNSTIQRRRPRHQQQYHTQRLDKRLAHLLSESPSDTLYRLSLSIKDSQTDGELHRAWIKKRRKRVSSLSLVPPSNCIPLLGTADVCSYISLVMCMRVLRAEKWTATGRTTHVLRELWKFIRDVLSFRVVVVRVTPILINWINLLALLVPIL